MRIRALAAVAVAAVVVVPVGMASTASAAPGDALVTVVHGIAIPDFEVVDVYVNGALTFEDLTFGDVLDAELPAGSYDIDVTLPDAPIGEAALSDTFEITGDVSIVAQVDALGAPVLVTYPDDYSPTAAGQARVVVRHAAEAADVSVDANGAEVIASLSNGNSAALEVPAGTYSVVTKLGGNPVEGLSAEGLALLAGKVYTVYAVGDDMTFETSGYSLIVDVVDVGEDVATTTAPSTTTAPATTTKPAIPTAVPAGDGSSGWSGPLGLPALIAITLAAGLAVAAGFALRGNATHRR